MNPACLVFRLSCLLAFISWPQTHGRKTHTISRCVLRRLTKTKDNLFTKSRRRYQTPGVTTRLVNGLRHFPYEVSLPVHRVFFPCSGDDFAGILEVDGSLYPIHSGIRRLQRKGSAFSVRFFYYWNRFSASVVTATTINISMKGFRDFVRPIVPFILPL